MRTYYQRKGDNFPNEAGYLCGDIFYEPCVYFVEGETIYSLDVDGNVEMFSGCELHEFEEDLRAGHYVTCQFLH